MTQIGRGVSIVAHSARGWAKWVRSRREVAGEVSSVVVDE